MEVEGALAAEGGLEGKGVWLDFASLGSVPPCCAQGPLYEREEATGLRLPSEATPGPR